MQTRPEPTFEDYWHYALTVYDKDGVAAFLLDLQDAQGADVNLVLLLAFLHGQRRAVSAERLGELIALSEDWQTKWLRPHRQLRQAAKGQDPGRYQALKNEELALEKRASQALFSSAIRRSSGGDDPSLSINQYLQELGTGIDAKRLLQRLSG